MQTILVTGAAGFIGSNLVLELLRSLSPVQIIGLDNMKTTTMYPSRNTVWSRLLPALPNTANPNGPSSKATWPTKR